MSKKAFVFMFTLVSLTFAASAILTIISLLIVNTTWKSAKQSNTKNASDFEITIERGACFGFCPVYTTTVDGAGNVEYKGMAYVNTSGTGKYQIATEEVQKLIDAVQEMAFFDLESTYYNPNIADIDSMEISVTTSGLRKAIYVFTLEDSAEVRALNALGDLIDEVTMIDQYTKIEDPSLVKAPSITQGIYGVLQVTSGNCMPGIFETYPVPNTDPCRNDRISGTLIVRKAVPFDGVALDSEEVAMVVSDTDGFFEVELEPGIYSVFIARKGEEICTQSDGTNKCPVEVFDGTVSEYNPTLDLATY